MQCWSSLTKKKFIWLSMSGTVSHNGTIVSSTLNQLILRDAVEKAVSILLSIFGIILDLNNNSHPHIATFFDYSSSFKPEKAMIHRHHFNEN